MTRQHERVLTATTVPGSTTTTARVARTTLGAPAPGWFRPALTDGALVGGGATLGELTVLGRSHRVIAPVVHGIACDDPTAPGPLFAPRAVSFGDPLVVLDRDAMTAARPTATAAPVGQAELGVVLRAPTSGRFYGRPSPDRPPFVVAGDELSAGATVCLLEVMKTFHRVTYGGPGLPERGRVRAVLVADGDDVTAGAPLLAFE